MESGIEINELLKNLLNRRDFLKEMRLNPDSVGRFIQDGEDDTTDVKQGKRIFNFPKRILGFEDFVKEKSR